MDSYITSSKEQRIFNPYYTSSKPMIYSPDNNSYFRKIKNDTSTLRAGCIVLSKDKKKILFVKTKKCNKWGPPKGRLNKGESVSECAMRELFEETGIKVDISEDKKCYEVFQNCFFYNILLDEKILFEIHDKNEIGEIKWFDIDSILTDINKDHRNIFGFFCIKMIQELNLS